MNKNNSIAGKPHSLGFADQFTVDRDWSLYGQILLAMKQFGLVPDSQITYKQVKHEIHLQD